MLVFIVGLFVLLFCSGFFWGVVGFFWWSFIPVCRVIQYCRGGDSRHLHLFYDTVTSPSGQLASADKTLAALANNMLLVHLLQITSLDSVHIRHFVMQFS